MHYSVSFTSPQKQLIDIKITIENLSEPFIDLKLPAWRPGRYELQHYAKNIINFKVFDELNNSLDWEKLSRNTFRISKITNSTCIVTYSFFANQMDAGGSWLDDNQLYINPINCLMYLDSNQDKPHIIEFNLPDDYIIGTGLTKISKTKYGANNFRHLADSPIVASKNLMHNNFVVDGLPVHIWIQGECNPDWTMIEKDFSKFFKTQSDLFGSFPEKDYHFIFQILPYPFYHGVEHRNSTVITLGPDLNFGKTEFYTNILSISSHELFHAWNICKIRPKELMPYDLSKENYFPTGFVAEGVTTYYGDLMLLRSGVWNLDNYLDHLNDNLNRHFSNPARNSVSIIQSSIDLWVDGYTKSHPHRKVSIYDKGALLALILDLEIRKSSKNKHSLDDVMRKLWLEYGQKSIGYSLENYIQLANEMAGESLDRYFTDAVLGSKPLERILAQSLDHVGLMLFYQHPKDLLEQKFGLRLTKENGKWIVALLDTSSPAEKVLSLNDEIISINGKTDAIEWQKLYDKQMLSLTIIRSGKSLSKTMIADQGNYFPYYAIKPNNAPTADQRQNFEMWSGLHKFN